MYVCLCARTRAANANGMLASQPNPTAGSTPAAAALAGGDEGKCSIACVSGTLATVSASTLLTRALPVRDRSSLAKWPRAASPQRRSRRVQLPWPVCDVVMCVCVMLCHLWDAVTCVCVMS